MDAKTLRASDAAEQRMLNDMARRWNAEIAESGVVMEFATIEEQNATIEVMQLNGTWEGCWSMACGHEQCRVYFAIFGVVKSPSTLLAEAVLAHRATHNPMPAIA